MIKSIQDELTKILESLLQVQESIGCEIEELDEDTADIEVNLMDWNCIANSTKSAMFSILSIDLDRVGDLENKQGGIYENNIEHTNTVR
jgi:hypothetical protein